MRGPHRSRLGNIAHETASPPKIPYDFWIRYQLEKVYYPGIGRDSLQRNLPTQTIHPDGFFPGQDKSQELLPTQ